MAAPTPIHRDPDSDGDDYGCVGHSAARGNAAIAAAVNQTREKLSEGEFASPDSVVDFVREQLIGIQRQHKCGACDTVVKENVFAELQDAVEEAGLDPIEQFSIYGW